MGEAPPPGSWAAAARPPPTPHQCSESPLGASIVPFVENLLHKALLNCLELGTSVPMEMSLVWGIWENLLSDGGGAGSFTPRSAKSPYRGRPGSMSSPKYLLHPDTHVQGYTHKHAHTEFGSWLPNYKTVARGLRTRTTAHSQTETSNADSSPPTFIWGPLALEVVTVDTNPCGLWRGSLFPFSWSAFSGQARPAPCQGRAGGPGP